MAQYRQPADWSESALKQARATLDGWYGALRGLLDVPVDPRDEVVPADFEAALCDDLNTPEAFAILSRLVDDARKATIPEQRASAKAKLLGAAHLLGLLTLHRNPQAWFQQNTAGDDSDVAQIEQLVAARQSAKQTKNFALADSLRAQLGALGVVVEDSAQGPRWKRVSIDELA